MNCNNEIFRKTFEDTLDEQGFTILNDTNNIYSIVSNNNLNRITTAILIGSEPIKENLHRSINDTEIKAIGFFKFKLAHENIEPNFYIFAFSNNHYNKVEFVIIPFTELKNRIASRKCNTDKEQETELRLWLLPDYYLFETTNFGAEGEFWFVDGRMAVNTNWDYTMFLNGWNLILSD